MHAFKMKSFALAAFVILNLAKVSQSVEKEFCERETFEAECGDNQVIFIHSARYGRMEYGRCVEQPDTSQRCNTDVRDVLSEQCSGRRTCSMLVTELHTELEPGSCRKDIIFSLLVNYTCVTVTSCSASMCSDGGFRKLTSTSGFLPSLSSSNGCGSEHCRWLLEPHPGQRFNITFHTFISENTPVKAGQCLRLARLIGQEDKELVRDLLLCGRHSINFLTPPSKPILIELTNVGNYLIHYEVIGCHDLEQPEGGWMRKAGVSVEMGCDNEPTITRWRVTCTGTAWSGETGSCQTEKDETGSWDFNTTLKQAGTTHGLLLVVGIGVVLGIILGFTMLTGAIFYLRRKQRRRHYERESRLVTHTPTTERCPMVKTYDKTPTPTGDKKLTPDELNAYRTYHAHEIPAILRQQSEPHDKPHVTSVPVPVAPPPPLLYQGETAHPETVVNPTGKLHDHVYESPHLSGPGGSAPIKKNFPGPRNLDNRASLS